MLFLKQLLVVNKQQLVRRILSTYRSPWRTTPSRHHSCDSSPGSGGDEAHLPTGRTGGCYPASWSLG